MTMDLSVYRKEFLRSKLIMNPTLIMNPAQDKKPSRYPTSYLSIEALIYSIM